MGQRSGSYLGGHTIFRPDKRPLEQRLASAATHEKRKTQKAQKTFDREQQRQRNKVQEIIAEDERLRQERFAQRRKESARFRRR